MSKKQSIIQIRNKGKMPMATMQAVQLNGSNWPGLYLAGDCSLKMAMAIRYLERDIGATLPDRSAWALEYLVQLAAFIENDVDISAKTNDQKSIH
jgi:hypothetical protein